MRSNVVMWQNLILSWNDVAAFLSLERRCPIKLESCVNINWASLSIDLLPSEPIQPISRTFFPAKKIFLFLAGIFFLLLMIVSSSNQAQQCSSTTTTIKRKTLAAKVLLELTLTSSLWFLSALPPSFAPICEVVMSATPNFPGLARVSIGKIRFFWLKQKSKLARLKNSTDSSLF